MGNLHWNEETNKYEVWCGSGIDSTVNYAIYLAQVKDEPISFEFNGVPITVRGNSNSDLILRDFRRAITGCIDGSVGPYPSAELSAEEQAHDANIHAGAAKRAEESRIAYEAEMENKRQSVESRLKGVEMELADPQKWEEYNSANTDPYGAACVIYAEQWAKLMQIEMSAGQPIENIARETSHEADTEGITGFMYGCAVTMLAQCWKYGDELRRWHNIDTQISNEGEKANDTGGVLDPASLSIGTD
jgi:hypothetical protein